MNNNRTSGKVVGSMVAGVLQCVFGGILVLSFGLALLGMTSYGERAGTLSLVLVVTLLSCALLLRGIRNCRICAYARRVQGVMAGKSRESLSMLAQVCKQDYSHLVRGLRELSARGYFPGAYVDLNRREFVTAAGAALPPVYPGPTVLRETQHKSVVAIYLIAVVWIVYGLLGSMYRWYDFAICLALSVVVYAVLGRVLPKTTVIVEEARKVTPPPKADPINTGNTELDEVLTQAMDYMNKLTALDAAITNPAIDSAVKDTVHICKQIFDYIKKTPRKVRQIRQFMSYYLPTTISLLQNYDELSREPVKGSNIQAAMSNIETSMDTIVEAFRKELDNLYQDRALDISVDIEVLQNMMDQGGLSGDITKQKREQY